jgi:hypothetical protein
MEQAAPAAVELAREVVELAREVVELAREVVERDQKALANRRQALANLQAGHSLRIRLHNSSTSPSKPRTTLVLPVSQARTPMPLTVWQTATAPEMATAIWPAAAVSLAVPAA